MTGKIVLQYSNNGHNPTDVDNSTNTESLIPSYSPVEVATAVSLMVGIFQVSWWKQNRYLLQIFYSSLLNFYHKNPQNKLILFSDFNVHLSIRSDFFTSIWNSGQWIYSWCWNTRIYVTNQRYIRFSCDKLHRSVSKY